MDTDGSTSPYSRSKNDDRWTTGAADEQTVLQTEQLSVYYDRLQALNTVTMAIPRHRVTAIIGPSGCGKSTLLRCFNRTNDLITGTRIEGGVWLNGIDLYGERWDVMEVRYRIGMVFQQPNPFPKSVYDNVAFGPRLNGFTGELDAIVEQALRDAALWEEVRDRLQTNALALSGGQQQRLCIARALAVSPEVLLMDEPASALDPVAANHIEELIERLKQQVTVVIVTHNMQQAARVSDRTAFLLDGELVEFSETGQLFTRPEDSRTERYITGQIG